MTRSRPSDPALEADLARGVSFHQAGSAVEAEAAYRAVLARAPNHPYALNYLGTLMAATGRRDEGIDLLRRSVKQAPTVPELHLNLADALAAEGRLDAAESSIRKSLALKRSANGLAKFGIVLFLQGRLRPARHQLEQALALEPGHVAARHNLGTVAAQLDDRATAGAAFRGTLAQIPSHLDALNALGALEDRIGEAGAAIVRLRRALAVSPDFAPAHVNIAPVLEALGRIADARRHYRRTLALSPGDPTGMSGFGSLLLSEGLVLAAETASRRAVALDGSNPDILSNLGRTLNPLGRTSEAISIYRRALELNPRHVAAHSNLLFAMALDPATTNQALFEEYRLRDLRQAVAPRHAKAPRRLARAPSRRLRIGFLSADLRDHPIGHLMVGYFENADRDAVSLHVYSEHRRSDRIVDRIRTCVDVWRETGGLGDEAVATMIAGDEVDILVLLAGQTGGNRARVCAYRPAAIQVNLHDLSTSGMETVDVWLTDPVLHPETTTEGRTERLVRLPSLYLYPRLIESPDVVAAPESPVFTLGSFSNPAKINDEVLAVWARVLAAVEPSRLVMAYLRMFDDPGFRALMQKRLGRFGVAADRIVFAPPAADRRSHLARYSAIDVALDPFPFTGGTTTFEAMWMGVPVVTLAGERFAARSAASHLVAAGYPELIATSVDDYVSKVVALARTPGRLTNLRQTMRARVAGSRLCDAETYARSLDAVWKELWAQHCGQEPATNNTP